MHQTIHNVNQLNSTSVRFRGCGYWGVTNEFNVVHVFVPPDKLVNVPILHPLGTHRKLASAYCYFKQW
jgi:hypothetical protein